MYFVVSVNWQVSLASSGEWLTCSLTQMLFLKLPVLTYWIFKKIFTFSSPRTAPEVKTKAIQFRIWWHFTLLTIPPFVLGMLQDIFLILLLLLQLLLIFLWRFFFSLNIGIPQGLTQVPLLLAYSGSRTAEKARRVKADPQVTGLSNWTKTDHSSLASDCKEQKSTQTSSSQKGTLWGHKVPQRNAENSQT